MDAFYFSLRSCGVGLECFLAIQPLLFPRAEYFFCSKMNRTGRDLLRAISRLTVYTNAHTQRCASGHKILIQVVRN
jgi:hypothetical protein